MTAAHAHEIAEEDRLRADLYNYLGLILAGPPDRMLLDQTAGLVGDDSPLGLPPTERPPPVDDSDLPDDAADLDQVLERAARAGVDTILTIDTVGTIRPGRSHRAFAGSNKSKRYSSNG